MSDFDKTVRFAINSTLELVEAGQFDRAFGLLDAAIEQAERADRDDWVRTLCHHAAIIARYREDWGLAKSYYERSLAANPKNPRALYGLAAVALDSDDPQTARHYAERCYAELIHSDNEILREGLLPLLEKHWPDLTEPR